ncbi:LysM domain-containing GPI-anchored protein 1 [Abeliophyllum distichum]|uniref:LysM domain-containing GPI-anchored protein 1 n=1 Tax=Abeliophyllum distichum TaxID=126358 RepID=A0ABD1SBL1_9LAMI
MATQNPTITIFLLLLATFLLQLATAKSTIEPCSNAETCSAVVGYSLYTDLKVSELAALFSVDPISLLLANAIDISYPDVENHILPSKLFIKIPTSCSCVAGIRKSSSIVYKTRSSDTLASISAAVYGGLVSADQIKEANPEAALSDPSVLNIGTKLNIPLPCTCFDNSDNNLPTIYMSYVVAPVDTLTGIAVRYATTLTDLMNVNALGNPAITEGDILAIPLSG